MSARVYDGVCVYVFTCYVNVAEDRSALQLEIHR